MLDTTRRVATPEGIELTLHLAGPVPRALAWAIDFLLRIAVVVVVMIAATPFGRSGTGVILVAAFFVEWLLPAGFEAMWNGQTPGKRALGLRVLNDDGTPLRWPGALTRNLLRAADFLPVFYGVGLVAMLGNRDFKRLGDLAAATVVVDEPEQREARKVVAAPPVAPPFPLALADQRALLELGERAGSLTTERLQELAELPTPLLGAKEDRRDGASAAARLLGMANYIAGRH